MPGAEADPVLRIEPDGHISSPEDVMGRNRILAAARIQAFSVSLSHNKRPELVDLLYKFRLARLLWLHTFSRFLRCENTM